MMRATALFLTILALTLTLSGAPGQAQSLDALRQSGAIGERYDGYVAVRQNVPGAASVAAQVNAERRRIYEQRARQQNISPAQVGMVYAQQIVGSAPAGTWFLDQSGTWRRK
jgi:uncharacterized protein YdbL (DUF1318 family)